MFRRVDLGLVIPPLGLLLGIGLGLLVAAVIPDAESQGPAGQVQPHRVLSIADVTVAGTAILIDAADENRLFLNCTNTDTTNAIRWGELASISATRGQRVASGATITISGTYAVYAIRESANSVVLSCTKEFRS